MIVLVDYKAGNLASVAKAFTYLGERVCVTDDPGVVVSAQKIVLPGVGNFAATQALERSGIRAAIGDAISRGKPFLGICVGMQWLFDGSEEAPSTAGLGVMRGTCCRFVADVKSPHVGWNRLSVRGRSQLLREVEDGTFVYFTHSYRAPVTEATSGIATYGGEFAAAVEHNHVFGVQFHPEKSGAAGLQILRNFAELPC